MLQPLLPFTKSCLDELAHHRPSYLVSQTYHRGLTATGRTPLLLTHYRDRAGAQAHLASIRNDRYAALIDLEKAAHRERIYGLLSDHAVFDLYWPVIRSRAVLEGHLNRHYKKKLRRYLSTRTTWKISGSASLDATLDMVRGELMLLLQHGDRKLHIHFAEIEKL